MVRLRKRFLNKPLEMILHPVPKAQQVIAEKAQAETEKQAETTIEQLKAQEYFEKGVAKHQYLRQFLDYILVTGIGSCLASKRG